MNKKKTAALVRTPPSLAAQVQHLQAWYQTAAGEYVLEALHETVQSMSEDVFGYYALALGLMVERCDLLAGSRIGTHLKLSANPFATDIDLIAEAEALPIEADNVDLVIACHVLDYARSPHQVLREIERVLVADGHCILIGFNPYSWRGLGSAWKYLRKHPEQPAIYTPARIRDWFQVLGFEVLETRTLGFRPARGGHALFKHSAWLERCGEKYQLPLGNLQIIHVRKQTMRLTPIKASRRKRTLLKPGMAINPSNGRILPYQADEAE